MAEAAARTAAQPGCPWAFAGAREGLAAAMSTGGLQLSEETLALIGAPDVAPLLSDREVHPFALRPECLRAWSGRPSFSGASATLPSLI